MDITRTPGDDALHLAVNGRLDGYWADHLESALAASVREGHHHLRLDLGQVTFLSSAGIAVLMKYYKQLTRISGSLAVINPSTPVRMVLEMTRLSPVLIAADATEPITVAMARVGRRVDTAAARFEVFDLEPGAVLTCRAVGTDAPLGARDPFGEQHCASLGSLTPLFAVGVGAFGEGFADCRKRFGELLSVAGATGYQPADGTNVPDYLVATGPLPSDVRVLYCLACEGGFTRLARFESRQPGGIIGMHALLEGCLEIAGASAIGIVMVSEASGLVGAALRRSPAEPREDGDLFAHPGIRSRLTFTAERAYLRTLTVSAGVVARAESARGAPQLRPAGPGLLGHLHAAAFPFRPLRKGEIDLKDTVTSLFEHEHLMGVLHLLHDDRGAGGAGESEFIRGACWIGPLAGEGLAGPVG